LTAQVPRQVSYWASRQYFDRQNTTSDPIAGVTDVNEIFDNNLYNINSLPVGSYTVTTSRNALWNRAYGLTLYTDRWWWTMPTGRMRSGWRNGQNASLQDPGIMPPIDPPWGKANTTKRVDFLPLGSFSISRLVAETQVRLRHVSVYGGQERGIRVSVTAVEMQLSPTGVWEPGSLIPPRKISVRGRALDENGQAIITLPAGDHDVTPVVSQIYPYYTFTFDAAPTKDHHRTRSYHPYFATIGDPGVPDNRRINLFSDPDTSVSDADPRLITAGLNVTDAVPVGAELFIYDSPFLMFPKPFNNIFNPDYFDIKFSGDLDDLHKASFSQIKQVNSIKLKDLGNLVAHGLGVPPNITLTSAVARSGIAWMHELGHNLGLIHRNGSPDNLMFDPSSAGAPISSGPGREINRSERPAFER
jgi:hypothetical protein